MKKNIIYLLAFILAFSLQSAAYSLEIANTAISNVTRISADYYGEVIATNGSGTNPTVTVFYGTSDSGTNTTNWTYSCAISNVEVGGFSTNLTSLTPAKYYYCRAYAEEGTSAAWAASSTSFWTLAGAPTNAYPAATGGVFLIVSTNGVPLSPTGFLSINSFAFQSDVSNAVADWSFYPATQTVDMAYQGITFGGVTRTNWPEHGTGDVNTWSFYPATQTVDMAYQGIIFGGVTRTNWPVDATAVAASNAALGIRVVTLEGGVSNLQSATSNNLGTNWSGYPATQTVNMAYHGITLGGTTRTNWPSIDASEWSVYPAEYDVDIANRALFNVAWIELGGVYRSSWPVDGTNWAATPASTNINLAGYSISNGTFLGTIPALTNYATNAHTHAGYLTNAASWSGYPATQTVNLADRGIENVSALGLGGVTRTNWPGTTSAVFTVDGTYPAFVLPVGLVEGSWSDFEIKASTNNFQTLLYYFRSWTNDFGTNTDSDALVLFTDDYAVDPRQHFRKTYDISIFNHFLSADSVCEWVYFYPSTNLASVPADEWMTATNSALVWSWSRVDALGHQENIAGNKIRWSKIEPVEWLVERPTDWEWGAECTNQLASTAETFITWRTNTFDGTNCIYFVSPYNGSNYVIAVP